MNHIRNGSIQKNVYITVADPENSERGAKKHDIWAATCGGHICYDYFYRPRGGGGGGMDPLLQENKQRWV